MIKYFSDKLNKFFTSEQECVEAEKAHEEALAKAEAEKKALNEKRAERAKKIDELYSEAAKAYEAYYNEVSAFVRDYGSYHKTYHSNSNSSLLPSIFDFWF